MNPNHSRGEMSRNIVFALWIALLVLAMPARGQQQTEAVQPLRLAANHGASGDVVAAGRLMRAVKRANLRGGPGTSYDRAGALEVGEVVWVTEEVGTDWLRIVTRRGTVAFVYAPLLAHLPRPGAIAGHAGAVRGVAEAHRAVWRIRRDGHYEGTVFAIGPRRFVTALHVLLGVRRGADNLAAIAMTQDGNSAELHLNRVLAVNVAHDLVYVETTVSKWWII